jgi:hypothetical protein
LKREQTRFCAKGFLLLSNLCNLFAASFPAAVLISSNGRVVCFLGDFHSRIRRIPLSASQTKSVCSAAKGFFSRKPRDGPVAPNGAGVSNGHHHAKRTRRSAEPYSMATRPSFGQWLKYTWLDILTMAIMGAIGLGVRCFH